MIVADASFLTDFFLNRRPAVDALAEIAEGEPQSVLHAPELIEPEVLNSLRRLLRTEQITDWQAEHALADMDAVRLIRYPHAPLRRRVWALRDELSSYDATYLALAEGLGEATMFTSDAGLAASGRRHLGADRVRHTA